ncbi:MAG: DNA adenine methylase [Acidimicrobiia bacterium]
MFTRPFLKWVGGKRQLLPVLRRFYPETGGRYFEPFLGSGAVFFDLAARGFINGHGAVQSDANPDLIGCYRRVRQSKDDVLARLEILAADHKTRGRDCYIEVRDQRFNPMRAAWYAGGADLDDYSIEMAAMMIYLNRTGFNGLFRVNASGEYNVPPGRYEKPRIVDRVGLAFATAMFSFANVHLEHAPYTHVLERAHAGDFVYFDPPYAPLSRTANFRSYTGRLFGDDDHQVLQQMVIALAQRGVHVLLSNSTAPIVRRLYENNPDAVAAGIAAWRIPARRSVNSHAGRRGTIDELVVSNRRPH